MTNASKSSVAGLLRFLDSSPSPFHAVEQGRMILEGAGFERLTEGLPWTIKPNGKYFFTRNGSSLVAFSVGGQFNREKSAFNIVAAHTDSPCLRVKPASKKQNRDGFLQVAVETYGGGLWHTWFDRDLGVAGRLITLNKDGGLYEKLVNIDKPIFRIPTLAIHLDRGVNSEGFKFNTESQLLPIMATESLDNKNGEWTNAELKDSPNLNSFSSLMHRSLVETLKESSNTEKYEIAGIDLCLYDTQKASIGGIHGEFIQSARLDNLFMSYAGLMAFASSSSNIERLSNINVLALYDNEEVGSLSFAGAESTLISSAIKRILRSLDVTDLEEVILSKSFLLSADMAHAVHPNYSDKHDECHRPKMQKGIVLKYNSNQRYTTNSRTAAFIKSLASRNGIPIQEFMVKNDSPCGSTIGPIVAAQLGLQAVDVGAPQLSMHSIREMAGVDDLEHSIDLFKAFYDATTNIGALKTLDNNCNSN